MKAAVSRLEFGPEPGGMEVTNIETGHFVFTPVPGKRVSYEALDQSITDAGYEIESASIQVTGSLADGTKVHHLRVEEGGQVFHLEGEAAGELRKAVETGPEVTVSGSWSSRQGTEVIIVRSASSPRSRNRK